MAHGRGAPASCKNSGVHFKAVLTMGLAATELGNGNPEHLAAKDEM